MRSRLIRTFDGIEELIFMLKIHLINQKNVLIILYFILKLNLKLKKNLRYYRIYYRPIEAFLYAEVISFDVQNEQNTEDEDYIRLQNTPWNNNDIIGCGLVYSPSTTKNFSYIFFTLNGEQIGKPILLNENCADYGAFISVMGCSVETNFGKDLKANPFVYDFSKHKIHKYSDFGRTQTIIAGNRRR
uniref:Uncharacterized protein n=1 Tax=Meloidogyne incognita TaxID=6306 RepID=A0A914M7W2_MELIC